MKKAKSKAKRVVAKKEPALEDLGIELYRYSDYIIGNQVYVALSKYYAVRQTPHFYFFISEFEFKRFKTSGTVPAKIKRTGKGTGRRFCYESKADALDSYKHRKASQLQYAIQNQQVAELALKALDGVTELDTDELGIGTPEILKAALEL
jgi:hypothetical protein